MYGSDYFEAAGAFVFAMVGLLLLLAAIAFGRFVFFTSDHEFNCGHRDQVISSQNKG